MSIDLFLIIWLVTLLMATVSVCIMLYILLVTVETSVAEVKYAINGVRRVLEDKFNDGITSQEHSGDEQ